ncbi:MAG: thiamine diphosphokinase [Lachnospiraceae bacterium]|nr:thiamine diphosphokinase [Lachnospiraceae bacterium]
MKVGQTSAKKTAAEKTIAEKIFTEQRAAEADLPERISAKKTDAGKALEGMTSTEKASGGRKCFIVGAGEFDGFLAGADPGTENLLIAADGGYRHLQSLGRKPDVLLGDFDSLEVVPEHEHLIRHSPIKDDTDMALAVAYAQKEGYRTFFLYGGLGGRLDHTLANIQLLTGMSKEGLEGYLIGEDSVITAVTDGKLSFPETASGMVSVFCMGASATGVYERGLKYSLEDAILTCDRALGVSNEFTGEKSSIAVRSGTLLIMWDAKNGLPSAVSLSDTRMQTSIEDSE